MNYEMVIVPHTGKTHPYMSQCIQCAQTLVPQFEIKNHYGSHDAGFTDYEGVLKMCSACILPHLELNDVYVDFKEPVVIGWN